MGINLNIIIDQIHAACIIIYVAKTRYEINMSDVLVIYYSTSTYQSGFICSFYDVKLSWVSTICRKELTIIMVFDL
jgi:hypothetical protein